MNGHEIGDSVGFSETLSMKLKLMQMMYLRQWPLIVIIHFIYLPASAAAKQKQNMWLNVSRALSDMICICWNRAVFKQSDGHAMENTFTNPFRHIFAIVSKHNFLALLVVSLWCADVASLKFFIQKDGCMGVIYV